MRYIGFGPGQDEKFYAKHAAIRTRLPAADLKAERLTCIFLVAPKATSATASTSSIASSQRLAEDTSRAGRAGSDDSHNTLETKSNLPAEVIEEYELKQTALGKAIAKPPKAPREPFTRELTTHQSEEVKELRIADAAELLDVIGIDASGRTARQFRPAAELKVFSARPISAGAFVGLRDRLARDAMAADPARVETDAVTAISSLRGGVRPVDTFSVMDDAMLNAIVGGGALSLANNGTAMKIVPPLDLFLKAKYTEDGNLLPGKELEVKAHMVALVADLENPAEPIFRCDDAAFAYPDNDRAAYRSAMKCALITRGAPAVSHEFLAWAHRS